MLSYVMLVLSKILKTTNYFSSLHHIDVIVSSYTRTIEAYVYKSIELILLEMKS